jgi:UDP-N-acetylmuramate dehydrogenase
MTIEEHIPLSTLTTFRTGGPARFLLSLESAAELPDAAAFAKEKGLPLIPLGGGSNLLAPDEGVEAVFVRLLANVISAEDTGDTRVYTADAGAIWDALVARATADDAWGMENLSAVPGTVGAAVVQNIGAYGAALSDTVQSVDAFDIAAGSFKTFRKEECRFGYRTSIFKESRDRYFITSVKFALSKTPAPNLSYRDLAHRFGESAPSITAVRDAVIEIRRGKFPPLSSYGTAGSFFLNPIVSEADIAPLKARYPDMPLFDLPEGGVKAPLGWIFDRVMQVKGMREGGAFVWEKQALVIAADSGASARDVRALAEKIALDTKEKTGITVIPEVRIL